MLRLSLLLLVLLLSGVSSADVSVLFIGTTYTEANDMIYEFQQIAQSRLPGTTVTVSLSSAVARSLGEAAADTNLTASLQGGVKYDYIVLQENSVLGAIPNNVGVTQRVDSEDAVRDTFSPIANAMGAKLIFYQTWGRRNTEGAQWGFTDFLMMERCLEDGYATYADIASRQGCSETGIARAGLMFRKIYETAVAQGLTPSTDSSTLFYKLYGTDGSHPSVLGSYAIATAMFYAMFPQTSYTGWDAAWYRNAAVTAADAETISQAAFETSSSQVEQADPAVKQVWGSYNNSQGVVFTIRPPALMCVFHSQGDCYDLVVVNGVIECPAFQATVLDVSMFASRIEWSDMDVFTSPAVCDAKRVVSAPTVSPTTVPVPQSQVPATMQPQPEPSPTPPTPQPSVLTSDDDDGLSSAMIIVIVVGALLLVVLMVVGVVLFGKSEPAPPPTQNFSAVFSEELSRYRQQGV